MYSPPLKQLYKSWVIGDTFQRIKLHMIHVTYSGYSMMSRYTTILYYYLKLFLRCKAIRGR